MKEKSVEFAEIQDPSIEEALTTNGFIMSTIVGVSMLPTLRQNRDRVIIEVPREQPGKYDIVLYKRWDGQYVLHRVLEVREDYYVIRGDNTYVDEHISFGDVKGVATHFVRGGKMVDVTDERYQNYVKWLYRFYPLRKLIWRLHVFGSKVKRKIKGEFLQ